GIPATGVLVEPMREVVDEYDLRPTLTQRSDVQLGNAALPFERRRPLQCLRQRLDEGSTGGIENPDHHIGTTPGPALTLLEHCMGLADARRRTEVHTESTSCHRCSLVDA
ncbi:MAG: hypothetical protein QOH53_1869, partial [Ilumatobacteraceae bacterium]